MQHRIDRTDHGRVIRAVQGDEFVLELAEQATAGYEWVIVELPQGVTAELIKLAPAASAAIGAEAGVRLLLHAAQAPTGTLRLRHCQPWAHESGERADAEEFALTFAPA